MGSLLYYLPLMQYTYEIGIADSTQTMRYNQRGAVLH